MHVRTARPTATSTQSSVRCSPLVSTPSLWAWGLLRTVLLASTAMPQVWSTDWHRLSFVVKVEKNCAVQDGLREAAIMSTVERHTSCSVTR